MVLLQKSLKYSTDSLNPKSGNQLGDCHIKKTASKIVFRCCFFDTQIKKILFKDFISITNLYFTSLLVTRP
jgi:hypothetical protein